MKNIIDETTSIQKKTFESIDRINTNIQSINTIGEMTLEQLRQNGEQLDDVIAETNLIDKKLDISKKLQRKFEKWNGKLVSFFNTNNINNNTNNNINTITNTTNNNNNNNNINTNLNYILCNNVVTDNNEDLLVIKNNDIQINQSLDNISNSLDNIINISTTMNETVKIHNNKLDKLENSMNTLQTKQETINKRLQNSLMR